MNIAVTKVRVQSLTASNLGSNVQSLQNFVQAYLFPMQIQGTPPYWEKFMYRVVAMLKQLRTPTCFIALSWWPEFFETIDKTQGLNLTEEKIEEMSCHGRCSMLNVNPVIVAKHFQYRVETFFTEVLLTKVYLWIWKRSLQ